MSDITIKPPQNIVINLENVLANPSIPKIYANGFSVNHGLTDATVVLLQGALPVGALQMSFNSIKTLHKNLGTIIESIEKYTSQKVLTADEIQANFMKINTQNIKK